MWVRFEHFVVFFPAMIIDSSLKRHWGFWIVTQPRAKKVSLKRISNENLAILRKMLSSHAFNLNHSDFDVSHHLVGMICAKLWHLSMAAYSP